jgi:hypothetical protein
MSKQGWLPVVAAVMVVIPLWIVMVATDWGPQGSPLHFSQLVAIAAGILIAGHLVFHPRSESGKAMEEVRQRQAEQASQLEDLVQILPHLLPESQRAHLLRLRGEVAEKCEGTPALRGDLRRLCAMGLVRVKMGRRIRQIVDSVAVAPADYVDLTSLGGQWIESILTIERAERPAARQSGGEGAQEE